MSKRTAVIDIGSNSARMAVFEKSSRFAFHLISETKSRVRIGEGAYNFDGFLQEAALQRAFCALEEFSQIIKNLKCNKVICIATSALRDAPNASVFIKKVSSELHINIKIIEGTKEAYYGAVGSINYLKEIKNAITLDIGGGSTELARIENGNIVETISLDIGTVRLKELYFDKKVPLDTIRLAILREIQKIPNTFYAHDIIGIGGTLRSLSKMIMEKTHYPLKTVHGFEYEIAHHAPYINAIICSDVLGLKNLGVRKDRYDTMREGCIIFESVYEFLCAKKVVTSGAGVREGAYLCDILRASGDKFNPNFKLSLRSIKDRFSMSEKDDMYVSKVANLLFDTLSPLHNIPSKYKLELSIAAELYNIGIKLGFYQHNLHSFYFVINNLNYGFSHREKILIAILIKYHTKKLPTGEDIEEYKTLLPDMEIINWLSFLLSLAKAVNLNLGKGKISCSYENHTLTIVSDKKLFLAKEQIKQLVKPASFAIIIK